MAIQIKDVIHYHKHFLSIEEANNLFDHLMQFQMLTRMMELKNPSGGLIKHDFGKMMFLDEELITNTTFPKAIWGHTTIWSDEMLVIKKRIENYTNHEFRTCVCIFYPDGNSGVDFHSDKPAFGDTSVIPSLSLGEERPFVLRAKNSILESTRVLHHGSLLLMKKGCQEYFEHSLPVNSEYKKPRINLTFRQYGFDH